MATYLVKHTRTRPTMQGHWDGPAWNSIESVAIASACPGRVSRHKPETHVKLQYDGRGIYGIFKVKDQYIRCTTIQHNGSVCTDSCVEFFVKPHRGEGYFNFEFNCGGTLLCSYIRDHTRIDGGFRDFTPIPREDAVMLDIYHTMPRYIPQEIEEQREWHLEFFIPLAFFAKYTGPLETIQGQTWRANFYKCGDKTSHPHWLAWTPLPEVNFHLPEHFGHIQFEEPAFDPVI